MGDRSDLAARRRWWCLGIPQPDSVPAIAGRFEHRRRDDDAVEHDTARRNDESGKHDDDPSGCGRDAESAASREHRRCNQHRECAGRQHNERVRTVVVARCADHINAASGRCII